MSRRDTSYVSTLLLLSMRTRTTFGAYHMTYVAYSHNFRCVPLDLCLDLCLKVITCVTLHATDTLRTVYVAAYCTTVHVVIHLMSYRDTTYVVRSRTATQFM